MNCLNKVTYVLDKVGTLSRWTNVAGIGFLFLMIVVTFIDVILRYIFNRPMVGIIEVTEVMMIAAIFLAIAHTYNVKGHISVDIITSKLEPRARITMESANNLIGLGIFAVVVWQTLAKTLWFAKVNAVHSNYFLIPSAPFAAIITLGCLILLLLIIRDFLTNINEAVKLGLKQYQWLLIFIMPISVLALAILWMQPTLWQLSLPSVGILGIIVSLVFMMCGMPIAFVLILTGFVFISHIRGAESALDILGTELYRNAGSYNWSPLPFFVILGFFCLSAKFGEDLYLAAYRWFGRFKGGLGIATIGACTAFAAIVGTSSATVATMGTTALPQMRKYNYDERLSSGCITAGATLGPVIPPSVPFITFGILTGVSIGDLFIAGIVPGLLIASCFVIIISVWCKINPSLGPSGERSGWRARFSSLKAGGPVVILFLTIIGGIYGGVFTPTEGGAIGATVAVFISLIMKRFTWKAFYQSLLDAGRITSMVFLIIIGAMIFTRFLAWCNLSATITEYIKSISLSPINFMLLALIGLTILGCFIDLAPLVLIGVPVLYPVATELGINSIWFAVLVCLAINLGSLTPPFGVNLFFLKGIAKDIPMGTIYRGALPFVLATLIAIALIFIAPPLATWLPAFLKE
jgi:tripartite ATP-independent transporter DctM subunit